MHKNKLLNISIILVLMLLVFNVGSTQHLKANFAVLETAVTEISVTPNPATVTETLTYQLNATVLPADATNKNITWISNDPAIATVTTTGLLTGITPGSTTITVTSVSNPTISTTIPVTVTAKIPVTAVSITPSTITLTTSGATSTLIATVAPSDASNKTVTWLSSNTSIATVHPNTGVVTAVGNGTAVITATSTDDQTIQATASAIVALTPVPVSGVTLNKTTLNFTTAGATETLIATITPTTATNKTVTWTSLSPTVATVSTSGVVTAISNGTTTIFVTTVDGGFVATASATVALTTTVSAVTLNKSAFTLTTVGATETLIATISPANATNKTIAWTSSNPLVATVSTTGVVTAVSNGSTIITATTQDGAKTASATATVAITIPVTGISLNKTALTFTSVNATEQLIATIEPANATNKNISWSSSNTSVATVSSTGSIQALRNGTTTITATTQDGAKTATATVTVNIVVPVTSITLNRNTATITQLSETVQLTATVNPSTATNKTVTYQSSNTDVATVSNNGLVTPVGNGTTTITVTSNNNITARATIIVNIGELYTIAEIIENSMEQSITLSDIDQSVIDQQIMSVLINTGKTLVLESLNMMGEVSYRWIFDGTLMVNPTIIDTQIVFASDDQAKISSLSNQQPGIILSFAPNDSIQNGIVVQVNVGTLFEQSELLNLYYYNPVTESLDLAYQYLLVNDSFVTLPLTHTSTYFLTTPITQEVTPSAGLPWWLLLIFATLVAILATVGYILTYRKKLKDAMAGF